MQNQVAIYQLPTAVDQCSAITHIRKVGGNNTFFRIRKEKERQDVLNKLQAMFMMEARVNDGMRKGDAASEVAMFFHGVKGLKAKQIQNHFAVWTRGGQKQDAQGKKTGQWYNSHDWTYFIKNYNNGCPEAVLKNEVFCKFIAKLFADTCRWDTKGNALHARLLDIWFSFKEVPGFGNIREWCAKNGRPVPAGNLRRHQDYPQGWSPRNLLRVIDQELPGPAAQMYASRGEHATHSSWAEQLFRDRSKLMPFQLVTFDDVRFDIRVAMPMPDGTLQVVYPQALFALDVATGVILHKGVVGTYTRNDDSDGGKKGSKRGFQHADMRHLITGMIEMFGVPHDWDMTFLVEKASASVDRTDQMAFERQFGIKVFETQRVEDKLHGFIEQGGSPWSKGWIESLFRLVHTRYNHLEGATGSHYLLTRGGVEGNVGSMVDECMKLAKKAREQGIPYEKVRFPLLTIDKFHDFLDDLVMRLNWRTTHNLQGFVKVPEIEIAPGKYLRMDDPQADSFLKVGAKMPPPRMEAPAEKLIRQMRGHNMDKLDPRQLLVMSMMKKPITVTNNRITISAAHISNDKLHFSDADTADMLASYNGKRKALVYFLSHDATQVHLFTNNEEMEYVGSPTRTNYVDMTDEHAILNRSGEVHRSRQQIRDRVADIIAPSLKQNEDRRAYNTALFEGSIPTDKITRKIEIAESQRIAKQTKVKSIEDMIDDADDIDLPSGVSFHDDEDDHSHLI